jgi:hypothetical protein
MEMPSRDWREPLRTLNLLLAPAMAVIVIIEIAERVPTLIEHKTVTLLGLLLFGIVSLLYLVDVKRRASVLLAGLTAARLGSPRKSLLTTIGSTIAILGICAAVGYVSWGAIEGYHYVMIASYKKEKALEQAELISGILERSECSGMRVRAYASGPGNPYYGLMLGGRFLKGTHLTSSHARETFDKCYELIKGYVDSDPKLITHYFFRPKRYTPLVPPPSAT